MPSPGRIVLLVLLALIAAVIAAEMPELRRYMKVRQM
jgi:hypothetical protein